MVQWLHSEQTFLSKHGQQLKSGSKSDEAQKQTSSLLLVLTQQSCSVSPGRGCRCT